MNKNKYNPKYDVFITCKSEDYIYAETIYDFLTDNGAKVFLASRELRKLGESEYRKAISDAMYQAYHLIIFSSKPEFIDSTWVYYEWDMFITAKLKGYKPGNIITILKDVKTDEINMALWKYESLNFDSYKTSILSYVETPQIIENKQRIIEARQKEEIEKHRKEQEEQKIKNIKSEFIKCAEEYQKKKVALSVDIDKIRALLSSLQITTISCPICETNCNITNDYCENCGWPLSIISAVPEAKYIDKTATKQLAIYKKIYSDANSSLTVLPDNTTTINVTNGQIPQLNRSKKMATKHDEEIENLNAKLNEQSGNCVEPNISNIPNNKSKIAFLSKEKLGIAVGAFCLICILTIILILATKKSISKEATTTQSSIPILSTFDINGGSLEEVNISEFECDTLVDLGLSVLWASQNIGAKEPIKRGNFYGWGVKDASLTDTIYSHYPTNTPPTDISGDKRYDIATYFKIDNKRLRIPTKSEAEELVNRCTWTKVIVNGQIGCKVTGPNGKSIFLPAAGWSENSFYKEHDARKGNVSLNYWTSSLFGNKDKIWRACSFHFNDLKKQHMGNGKRYYGFSIRPVADKDPYVEPTLSEEKVKTWD